MEIDFFLRWLILWSLLTLINFYLFIKKCKIKPSKLLSKITPRNLFLCFEIFLLAPAIFLFFIKHHDNY